MLRRLRQILVHYWQDILGTSSVGIITGWFSIHFARYGVTLTDEGYYLASARNLYHGEPLFTELHSSGLRNFDYLIAKLFIILPYLSVWQFRLLSCMAFVAMAMAWYLIFRYLHLPKLISMATLSGVFCVWITALRLYDLSYITIPFVVLPFVLGFWLVAQRLNVSRTWWWVCQICAGILLALACISRTTMIASIVVAIVVVLLYRFPPLIKSMIASSGIALAIVGVFYLAHYSSWSTLVASYQLLTANVGYTNAYKLQQLQGVLNFFWSHDQPFYTVLRLSFVYAFVVALLILFTTRIRRIPVVALAALLLQLFYLRLFWWSLQTYGTTLYDLSKLFSMYTWAAGMIATVCLIILLFRKRVQAESSANIFIVLLGCTMVFWQIFFTAQSFFIYGINFGFPVVALMTALSLWRWQMLGDRLHRIVVTGVVCLVFGFTILLSYRAMADSVYADEPIPALTAQFTELGRMGPIYSTPERVDGLTRLIRAIEDNTNPGDYILSYYDSPLVYFLSDTRPSVNTVWSSRLLWDDPVDDVGFRYLCTQERFPKLVVLNHLATMADGTIHAVHGYDEYYNDHNQLARFVQANFKPTAQFGTMSILMPKEPNHQKKYCKRILQ